MIAIPIALYVGWCLEAGWSAESARFNLGGGGPWIAAAPLELLGFLGLLIVATLILMQRSVGNVEREQATASDGDIPSI